ncbi:MAG: nicotinate-nucleotide adenylyltransferase [Anaerolineae bacterium]|nr:nicotinate-nucleotide adenylyltransferase [Anaerolineae bacterium]
MRVGVLGGTFDPVHYGHLVIAEEARVRLGLSQVIFVPAKSPPHKLAQPHSDATHRLRMVQLAIASNPSFRTSEIELSRPGPSYTADTLALLREQLTPEAELYFIMGMDSLAHILTWHRPARVLALARLAVARRAGFGADMEALESALPGISARTHFLDAPEIGISSHDLRRRVQEGLPIRYQVPDSVEAYIRQHGLYVGGEPGRLEQQGAGH